ncbi:MAG: MCE family protein, partial [Verrucomicrobia bacterium]|nr:MCE family protein [Verrucomicrobiota bacterium]
MLLLALCFQFAKTGSWFKPSYTLELQSENIGGIRPGADVLMAGIRIGEVKDIALGEEGLKGIIRVNILEEYKIRKDAIFSL